MTEKPIFEPYNPDLPIGKPPTEESFAGNLTRDWSLVEHIETTYASLDEMLEAYTNMIDTIEHLGHKRNEKIEKILAPVKAKLDVVNQTYEAATSVVGGHLAEVEAAIKTEVLKIQATVKAKRFMFVYNKGKKTWDGKRLEGYASAHPEILQMQNIGEPTVSIRKV